MKSRKRDSGRPVEPVRIRPASPAPIKEIREKDAPPKVRKREQKSGCLAGFMYFLFVLCLAVSLAVFAWMAAGDALSLNKRSFETTVSLPATQFTSETVETFDENGMPTGEKTITHVNIDYLSKTLRDAGLVQYEWLFKFFCRISNAETKVTPGEFTLKSSYDYRALISNLNANSGGIKTVDITFPEGFTMLDVFLRLDENGVASYDDLFEAAANANFKYDFLEGTEDYGAARLEGYLFPDTYQFYVGTEASSAINKLLNTFYYKFTPDMITQAGRMGYSMQDIITIASYIEKEAALDEDRPYVASVIYNRLSSGMTLGLDTTILYVHQDHEGEPDAEMLAEDSPYNTHIYPGLTPTPICNPGLASIYAALNPESTNYYYFYADIDTGKLNFFNDYNSFLNYANEHPNTEY